MPALNKSRAGEAVIGISAANNADNLRVAYNVRPGTRLRRVVISAGRNGAAISAAELNGRAQAIVYLRTISDQPPDSNITTATMLGQFPQSLGRVIGAAYVGDARFGGGIVNIPLSWEVQGNEQVVVEVSAWVDSTGAVVASESIVNLIADEKRTRIA